MLSVVSMNLLRYYSAIIFSMIFLKYRCHYLDTHSEDEEEIDEDTHRLSNSRE
jgi:hypothetical protein